MSETGARQKVGGQTHQPTLNVNVEKFQTFFRSNVFFLATWNRIIITLLYILLNTTKQRGGGWQLTNEWGGEWLLRNRKGVGPSASTACIKFTVGFCSKCVGAVARS